jgi:hypothetical protein
VGGTWPLRGWGKGYIGAGGLGAAPGKGSKASKGERERQRQAGSQPALYPCRIDLPCHSLSRSIASEKERERREGRFGGGQPGPL